MRIGSLKLTQFFAHEDEEVVLLDEHDRPLDGVFFLSGESESGKSTYAVDAICFALYGPRATRVSAFGLTQRDLRNRRATDEDETGVEATFVFDDGSVMGVHRTVTAKGSGTANVWEVKNGQEVTVATSVQAADRYICDRLGGLSRQQLPYSFVARQEEIDALASLQGAERRKAVHAMLGVSELEIARKEASQRLKQHELRIRQLDDKLGGRTLTSEQELLDADTTELTRARADLQQRSGEAAELTADRERAAGLLAPYQQAAVLGDRIERGETAIAGADEQLTLLAEQAAAHDAAAEQAARADELREQAEHAAAALQTVTDTGTRTKAHAAKQAELQAAVDARDALTASAQAAVAVAELPSASEVRATLRELGGERERLNTERAERAEQLTKLRDSGECYVCQRAFDSEHAHTEVLELVALRITAIDERLEQIATDHTDATELLPRAEQADADRAASERELVSAEARVAQLDGQLAAIAAAGEIGDRAALINDWKQCKLAADDTAAMLAAAVDAAGRMDPEAPGKLAAARERRDGYQAALEDLRAQLDALDTSDPAAFERLTGEITDLDRRISESQGALPLLERTAADAQQRLDTRRADFDAFSAELAEREHHHAEAVRLSRLGDMLAAFTESLVAEIKPTLEQLASDMLVKVTAGRRTAIRLDDDYNIEVQDADGEWFAGASLSGGARIRAAICLRLALTRLVSQRTGVPVRFLVMDEPLPSQDPSHVALIMELLDSLRAAFPQIFIISHVGDLHSNEHVDYVMRFSPGPGEQRIKLTYA